MSQRQPPQRRRQAASKGERRSDSRLRRSRSNSRSRRSRRERSNQSRGRRSRTNQTRRYSSLSSSRSDSRRRTRASSTTRKRSQQRQPRNRTTYPRRSARYSRTYDDKASRRRPSIEFAYPTRPPVTEKVAAVETFHMLLPRTAETTQEQTTNVHVKTSRGCLNTQQGKREYQEDREVAFESGPWSVFAVFDGHGGSETSTLLSRLFPRLQLEQVDVASSDDFARLMTAVYEDLDQQVKQEIKDGSGSTAVAAFVNRETGRLFLVNVGDSRALVVNPRNGKIVASTVDHKPEDSLEREYIETFPGGFVERGRVQGVLATSRAFGDFFLKTPFQYVSVEPDVTAVDLTQNLPLVVVLASDGLWDTLDNEQVAQRVIGAQGNYNALCEELAKEALRRGSTDNVTVLVGRIE